MKQNSIVFSLLSVLATSAFAGVKVGIELPKEKGHYLVTVAAVREDDPSKPIATFVAGEHFSTEAGTNRFAVEWNGLDDNHMPVPPGRYGIKAVYAPATYWPVDGEYHAFTAKYVGGIGSFLPDPKTPDLQTVKVPVEGDPVNSPMLDVATTEDGYVTFGYQYMENGKSSPLFRLHGAEKDRKMDYVGSWPSGGAGTNPCITTDGETVWAVSTDNSTDFVFRPDGRPFGNTDAKYRRGVRLTKGEVTDMTSWKRPGRPSVIAVTENGVLYMAKNARGHMHREVKTDEFVDKISCFDGLKGEPLGQVSVRRPQALAKHGERLYVLYRPDDATWSVGSFALADGLPTGTVSHHFDVTGFTPGALAMDRAGRFYLSDPKGNHVYRFSATGRRELTFGRKDAQESGTFDPETMMRPVSIALWRDASGRDRLLAVERDGTNRTSEWDAETGRYLGAYESYQLRCNSGYMIDPDQPSHFYVPVQGDVLARFVFDYGKGTWRTDAVFPGVSCGMRCELEKPVAVRRGGRLYFAAEKSGWVYRLTDDGKRVVRSAGIIGDDWRTKAFWHDANGNGEVDEDEKTPTELPGPLFTYHGQSWFADLSYVGMQQGGRGVWRCAPTSFDRHGNPVFTKWERLFEDPVFVARATGNPGALDGGNELDEKFSSDWMKAAGDVGGTIYVQARGGRSYSANAGAQYKISRYDYAPGKGYEQKWRVGRSRIANAGKADFDGAMRIFKPVNGIFPVVDQSRSGVFLFTDGGLYLDTLFAPGSKSGEQGVYRQPGEFFCGTVYCNRENGKMYYASGKYTPYLYEIQGWTATENPVKEVPRYKHFVNLAEADIAEPPEMAVALRGGVGKARIAEFAPSTGALELKDGSLVGWETAPEVAFNDLSGKATVKVRTLWKPDGVYLRWQVRKPEKLIFPQEPAPERLFVHDLGADTVGFYLRGTNDARFTFGLFKDEKGELKPMGVGFYPERPETLRGGVRAQSYRTPVGEAKFAHVGRIEGAKYGFAVDQDGKGYVLAAKIPLAALPFGRKGRKLAAGWRTRVNFDANLGGHNRFWWANVDGSANVETYDEPSEAKLYPGSWAQAKFTGFENGLVLDDWAKLGPFGGPGAEKFSHNPQNKKEVEKFFFAATYPPDADAFDPKKDYAGKLTTGYWPPERSVKWRKAAMAEMDCRAIFAQKGAQVYYGVTYITSPTDAEVTLELYSHAQTFLSWQLNGKALGVPEKAYADDKRLRYRRMTTVEVQLKKGVNELRFRGFCEGYAPFRAGAVVKAPDEVLWRLGTGNPNWENK